MGQVHGRHGGGVVAGAVGRHAVLGALSAVVAAFLERDDGGEVWRVVSPSKRGKGGDAWTGCMGEAFEVWRELPEEKLFLVRCKGWVGADLSGIGGQGAHWGGVSEEQRWKDNERLARESIRKRLVRWAAILASLVGGIAVVWRYF